MTTEQVRAEAGWLALREPADAVARSTELVTRVRAHLPTEGVLTVLDLGSGTGSMGRWLAPQLRGPQHWVLCERDADLLPRAVAAPPQATADGAPVTVEPRPCDITRLDPADVARADLVTASALLDMLTARELGRLATACAAAERPVLVTLSVTGEVRLTPSEPLDAQVREAFNDHQRRSTPAGPLLGPDAVAAAADAFRELGMDLDVRPSPWRLGPRHRALTRAWFDGWLAAACEQRPQLTSMTREYAEHRRAQIDSGGLAVTVEHEDLLARPR